MTIRPPAKPPTHGAPRPPKIETAIVKRGEESWQPPPDFEAREGDLLVVSYPEVTLPLAPYSTAKIGGLIYTRKLREGESVDEQFGRIYSYLERRAESDARRKLATFKGEIDSARKG